MNSAGQSIATLIVDDEAHARTNLRMALAAVPGWDVVGECASAADARTRLAGGGVGLVLLDVQMPVESGLQLARDLGRQAAPPLIVFVTAHQGHALDAFDVHALDYVVKPVTVERLRRALERAATMLEQRAAYASALRAFADPAPGYWQTLTVRSVGRLDQVAVADILWIDTAGNYVQLHLPARTLLHRSTLTELERYLDPAVFVRVHRRTLVRRDQLRSMRQLQAGSHEIALSCGARLSVSDRYLAGVRSAFARA